MQTLVQRGLEPASIDTKGKKKSPKNKFWNLPICNILNHSWCTIADVKITFPDDVDDDIEAVRELLANADKKEPK